MQLNQSRFRLNGGCGYVLRPDEMFRADYDPAAPGGAGELLSVGVRVMAARHLSRSGRGTTSPFVEVEVLGADCDSGVKLTSKTVCESEIAIILLRCGNTALTPIQLHYLK